MSRYKQPLRLCIRNNIQGLRTLNIIVFTFFYNINKGDLPLMYSCVFWCEFIDLVVFFFRIMKRVTGVTNNGQKKCTKQHRNTSKVGLLYLFYRKK